MRTAVAAKSVGVALLFAAVCLGGCRGPDSKSHEADDRALRALVDRTVAAAGRRDVAAYGRYYAPRWTTALPGVPVSEVVGPLRMQFATGYAIRMVTVRTGFSAAGDLGYAVGTYEQSAPDKSGVLRNTTGKWMSVFRKQPDGSWGAVADTYNVDPSP
jgi:ketosteroid isomerase-like protein